MILKITTLHELPLASGWGVSVSASKSPQFWIDSSLIFWATLDFPSSPRKIIELVQGAYHPIDTSKLMAAMSFLGVWME